MPLRAIPNPMPPPTGRMAGATRTVYFSRRLASGKQIYLGPVDAHIYPASMDAQRDPDAAKYKWAIHWWPEAEFEPADGAKAGHLKPEMGDMLLSDAFMEGTQLIENELSDPRVNVGGFVVMTAYFTQVEGENAQQHTPLGVN